MLQMKPTTRGISHTTDVKAARTERKKVEAEASLAKTVTLKNRPVLSLRRSSPLGLGSGFSASLTGAALLAFILISIGLPAQFVRQQQKREEVGEPRLGLLIDDITRFPVSKKEPSVTGDLKVPVTHNVRSSFIFLDSRGSDGLLLSVAGEDWDPVRQKFMKAIERAKEKKILTPEEDLRLLMAMDLVCLENVVAQARNAVNLEMGSTFVDRRRVAELQKTQIQARRQQAKAATLWEDAVKSGKLGKDVVFQGAMVRLLQAVRSRATVSEHLISILMEQPVQVEEDEIIRVQNAEANSIYEAVAALNVAGQIAANHPLIRQKVAEWLAILFCQI